MEGCPIVIRGTADGFEKGMSMPSTTPWTGSRTGRKPAISQLVFFEDKCSHHIICPGHVRHCGSVYENISSLFD